MRHIREEKRNFKTDPTYRSKWIFPIILLKKRKSKWIFFYRSTLNPPTYLKLKPHQKELKFETEKKENKKTK